MQEAESNSLRVFRSAQLRASKLLFLARPPLSATSEAAKVYSERIVRLFGDNEEAAIQYTTYVLADTAQFLNYTVWLAGWSAFETYIQDVLIEVYSQRPELLKAEWTITCKEAIENRSNIASYLIETEVRKLSFRSFSKINAYLKKNFQCELKPNLVKWIEDIYFIRNIIAHANGRMKDNQVPLLSEHAKVENKHILIEDGFADKMLAALLVSAIQVDRHLHQRYLAITGNDA